MYQLSYSTPIYRQEMNIYKTVIEVKPLWKTILLLLSIPIVINNIGIYWIIITDVNSICLLFKWKINNYIYIYIYIYMWIYRSWIKFCLIQKFVVYFIASK